METRDRRRNLALFGAALAAWLVVGAVVLTLDPVIHPTAGYLGALAMGLALTLTTTPIFWLVPFTRQHRISYRGAWTRAVRRGTWAGLVAGLFIVMRLHALFQPPIALFIVVLVLVAESTMSTER